jgi:hypothetical protein
LHQKLKVWRQKAKLITDAANAVSNIEQELSQLKSKSAQNK